MKWVTIDGDWKGEYRINEDAVVQHNSYRNKWVTINPTMSGLARPVIHMYRSDGSRTVVPLTRLMANAFMGGIPPNHSVIHKNSSKLDCALVNLQIVPKKLACSLSKHARRRAVFMVDRKGNILKVYSSAAEAAKANHYSQGAMTARCRREIKQPFKFSDVDFYYEDVYNRKFYSKATIR